MENTIINSQFQGKNYTTVISNGRHLIVADEPKEDGGQDEGFNPFELLLAALATCTTATLKMYADRKGWVIKNINITLSMEENDTSQYIKRRIKVEGDFTEEQLKRLLLIAEKCPVHKMLSSPNKIETTLI